MIVVNITSLAAGRFMNDDSFNVMSQVHGLLWKAVIAAHVDLTLKRRFHEADGGACCPDATSVRCIDVVRQSH
jgi:hypothetical protein